MLGCGWAPQSAVKFPDVIRAQKGKKMNSSDFTILFAEDQVEIQKLYKKNFEKEGFKVLQAEHGARALAELRENKVDLLVMDLHMPGMNTLELFPILKKDFPKLPVIIVSGRYVDLKQDFDSKGFSYKAFFNKPVSVGELREKVREILKIDTPQKV
jgi:CheY-like chemotaxis protein